MGWFTNGKCHSNKRLDGKVVIVTGSNSGIGEYTAYDLAKRGAEVVMACRSEEKAEKAINGILSKVPEAKLKYMSLDLSSLTSVRNFCQEFQSSYKNLHLLINNAGILQYYPWGKGKSSLTEDGFETHFQVNHLGHFLLTLLLLPLLIDSAPSRIINVSSSVHEFCSSLNFDDLNLEKSYNAKTAYGRSKLANILFTKELANRLKGVDVKAMSLHPGIVSTEMPRRISDSIFPGLSWILNTIGSYFMKSPEQGAQTTLYCALEDCVESGSYYDDCTIGSLSEKAKDPSLAKELWDKSVELVKLENYDPFLKLKISQ